MIERANAQQDQRNSANESMPFDPRNQLINEADNNQEISLDNASVKSECSYECECPVDSGENLRKVKDEPSDQGHVEVPHQIESAPSESQPESNSSESQPEPGPSGCQNREPKPTSSKSRKSPRLSQPGTSKSASAESKGSKRRCADDSKGTKGKKPKTRSKVVPSDDETEELTDEEDQVQVRVLALKCTEPDCAQMVPNRDALYGHLKTDHGFEPFPCLVQGCQERFKNASVIIQ